MDGIDSEWSAGVQDGRRPAGGASWHARLRRLKMASCLVGLGVIGGPAYAQGSAADRAAAEVLFHRALALMKVGDYAGACPQLEESQKLDPAVGTLLYLGECYEQQDKVASAWATFNAAADAARGARQPDRERMAHERAVALEPRLPKLIIVVDDEARIAGLEVTRNGVPVGQGSWGVPIPLDAGRYEVRATAPGRIVWSKRITVKPTGVTRSLRIPPLPRAASDTAPAEQPIAPRSPEAEDEAMNAPDAMVLAGGLVGAAGLCGLAVGIGFGVQAQNKQTESESFCQPPDYLLCTQQGLDLLDESATASTVANVGFVAGGLLAATGLVLVIVGAASDEPGDVTDQARITWALAPLMSMSGSGLYTRATW